MIVESAQMLSTAHRMLDGEIKRAPSKSGKTMSKHWTLPDNRESVLYKAVHMAHPCTVWSMINTGNYWWHYVHFTALCDEYTYRYGKRHKSQEVIEWCLINKPNIPDIGFTEPAKAMPDEYKVKSVVESYRNYYMGAKSGFAVWKNREKPEWFKEKVLDLQYD